jgi:NAD+ dependent glucose-6-phosphate dehydrogenase
MRPFAILNVMSANPGMRWDIESTRRLIGYQPQDGHIAINAPDNEETEQMAGAARDVIERLNWLSGKW